MKFPPHAKKVFTGILFGVYQWSQEMYEGPPKTFEAVVRKPSVDVLALVGDRIMVLRQEQPGKPLFPSLPGGAIEQGQTPLEAARAELLQETGHESEEWILLDEFWGSSKSIFHESVFVARECRKTRKPVLDGGEKIKVEWFDFDAFLQWCRNERFTAPLGLKFQMYEALLDPSKKEKLRKEIFGP